MGMPSSSDKNCHCGSIQTNFFSSSHYLQLLLLPDAFLWPLYLPSLYLYRMLITHGIHGKLRPTMNTVYQRLARRMSKTSELKVTCRVSMYQQVHENTFISHSLVSASRTSAIVQYQPADMLSCCSHMPAIT